MSKSTVKDLRQVAGAMAIPGRSKMNKAQLSDAIRQQSGGGATGVPFTMPNFGSASVQVGGSPTPMPWEWYNPIPAGSQVGGKCQRGGNRRRS